jgi:CBS domain-containing protein
MNVRDLMTTRVHTCAPHVSLETAARLLLQYDCGLVPVVEAGRVVGALTERDVCTSGVLRDRRLAELQVANAMTRDVVTCAPDENLVAAVQRMAEHQVRRMPVVGADGRVQGVLSLDDLARAAPARADIAAHALRVLVALASEGGARRGAREATNERRANALLAGRADREC